MGERIQNEDSVLYWCYKNDIPVYSPAFTDGAIGDCMYFDTYREKGFIVDLV
jgi:deoxyhypusine synthase